MIKDINKIILIAKQLRPGTVAYKEKDINSIDFSRYKFALERFSNSGNVFIRSSNINKEIMIQDPKQYHRKTLDEYKLHYHQYYIDDSPHWKEYPKRYNSLMFLSYNIHYYHCSFPTEYYGEYTYFVFPENNCKIAVSPTEDFINSFDQSGVGDLYDFNRLIFNLYRSIMKRSLRPKSYDEWKDMLMNMQIQFKKKYDVNPKLNYSGINEFYDDLGIAKEQFYDILLNGKLIDFIESITDPSKNNFFLANCNKVGLNKIDNYDYVECWTDGTCLLISSDCFDWIELTKLIKNKI